MRHTVIPYLAALKQMEDAASPPRLVHVTCSDFFFLQFFGCQKRGADYWAGFRSVAAESHGDNYDRKLMLMLTLLSTSTLGIQYYRVIINLIEVLGLQNNLASKSKVKGSEVKVKVKTMR